MPNSTAPFGESWVRRYTPVLYVVGGTGLLCLFALMYLIFFKGATIQDAVSNSATSFVARPVSTPALYPTISSNNSNTRVAAAKVTTTTSSDKEIKDLLDGWASAARAHDLDTQLGYYADTLDVYYKRTNVGKDNVRQDRMRAFDKYSGIDVQLSDVRVVIDQSGAAASATFDKTWSFTGEKNFSGSVHQMLWLTKIGGRWLISGEKDLKVYYTHSG